MLDLNTPNKTILVAPLNWGLGHATRCIPIIKALLENNYTPIIASDGVALELLQKEFPYLKFLELPSYQIEYPKKGQYFKWKLLKNCPKIIEAIYEEKKMVNKWIKKHKIEAIISDNRLGVISKKVPSVFITHQLNVLTGSTTWITSMLHQNIIQKYDECWVPDTEGKTNLSGKLGHLENPNFNIRYIGTLSRLNKKHTEKRFDLMVLLSGPEPQRSLLENKLKEEIQRFEGRVLFIRGVIENEQKTEEQANVISYNFMNSRQLGKALNESEMIICRSGYTTLMDLAKLNKKAFLIPTPGQYEQIYLAKKLKKEGILPYQTQEKFKIENLEELINYEGFSLYKEQINWKELFEIFNQKKVLHLAM